MSIYVVPLLTGGIALTVLFFRARRAGAFAPGRPASSWRQRFSTGKLLIAAAIAWLLINFQLQHLNQALSGDAAGPQSAWERFVRFVSGLL